MSRKNYKIKNPSIYGGSISAAGDPLAPGAPTLVDLATASDTGSSSTDNLTSDTTPDIVIDFATSPLENDVVEVRDNGVIISSHTVTAGEAGSANITLGLTLASGAHVLDVRHSRSTHIGAWSSTLTVTVDATAPTISTAATANCAENATLSIALAADETVAWSITGGADQARFEISGTTLRWASNGTKDFEIPNDADTNNTYVVQVTATDAAGNATNKTITVTVTDVPGDSYTFSAAYVDHKEVTVDSTTPTFSAIGIGAADTNRVVGIGFSSRQTNAGDTVSSVRVHTPSIAADATGALATHVTSAFVQGGNMCSDWWYIAQGSLVAPTATTADIVVTWTAASQRSSLATVRVVTQTPIPANVGTSNASSNPINVAATVPAGGAGFAIAGFRSVVNANNVTWTNATRDYSVNQMETFSTISVAEFTASATVTAEVVSGGSPTGSSISYVAWDD